MDQNFDLEALYKPFPRKEGKQAGMKKLATIIKTKEDYARFERAVTNYVRLLRERGTSPQYFLMFSTFVNSRWEEYEDTSELSGASSNRSLAEQIARGEL